MSNVYKRGMAEIRANLTPMIDVSFLLIVFFVLVSHISDVEHVEMALPRPTDPASETPGEEQRMVINIMPGIAGEASGIKFGTQIYSPDTAGLTALTDRLSELYQSNPGLDITLRADRNTHYKWIQSAIKSIGEAAATVEGRELQPRINLAVERRQ